MVAILKLPFIAITMLHATVVATPPFVFHQERVLGALYYLPLAILFAQLAIKKLKCVYSQGTVQVSIATSLEYRLMVVQVIVWKSATVAVMVCHKQPAEQLVVALLVL